MSNDTSQLNKNGNLGTSDTHSTAFDHSTDSASEELIKAVAKLNDADPVELPLLADFIDPEALDALFSPREDGTPRETSGQVEFTYDAYHVLVDSRGMINLYPHKSKADS
ncbi:HalOD1 output domain-containing protein [Haladaptatus caseinilyticus]|uniref:HalOD1 output domain-containing protein n=1 Tax=Haladaptatus caseinilyticus TaxID=2993314 RepID=UPI00224AE7C4|nr:HalOD1 output domain-containing protein [Haladaptatus caseinilyticus]